jgi:hypothetical protein
MKILNCLISLGLLFILNGCESPKWSVDELYAQKIEGTSKVLYKYYATGGLDAEADAYKILDSTENFKVKVSDDLNFFYLQEIPTTTIIKAVTDPCDSSCGKNYNKAIPIFTPVNKEISKKDNITIENSIYQYKGFGEKTKSLKAFQFETFKETRDSLAFYNLNDIESVNGVHADSLKIKKTNVIIRQTKNHEIIQIVIDDLIFDKDSNSIIQYQPYFLTSKFKLNSNAFSDYGIFKEVVK